MPRRILIVCQANTSRSIIAAALLQKMLAQCGFGKELRIDSGGIAEYARDGSLVSLDARLILREENIHLAEDMVSTDLKKHPELMAHADLILTMTEDQKTLVRDFPLAQRKRIYTLKELAGERGDIVDPVGRGEEALRVCRDEIKACLEKALPKLVGLCDLPVLDKSLEK